MRSYAEAKVSGPPSKAFHGWVYGVFGPGPHESLMRSLGTIKTKIEKPGSWYHQGHVPRLSQDLYQDLYLRNVLVRVLFGLWVS